MMRQGIDVVLAHAAAATDRGDAAIKTGRGLTSKRIRFDLVVEMPIGHPETSRMGIGEERPGPGLLQQIESGRRRRHRAVHDACSMDITSTETIVTDCLESHVGLLAQPEGTTVGDSYTEADPYGKTGGGSNSEGDMVESSMISVIRRSQLASTRTSACRA